MQVLVRLRVRHAHEVLIALLGLLHLPLVPVEEYLLTVQHRSLLALHGELFLHEHGFELHQRTFVDI